MREADVVIVGAGSAGCVLAARLTEDPGTQVLLLEAGGAPSRREAGIPAAFSRLFRTECDWNFWTVPQAGLDGRRLYWPRGRMLGGSSSMNAQMHVRGNRADFDGWAARGLTTWSWSRVLPAFRRLERCSRGPAEWRGDSGPVHVNELRNVNPLTHDFLRAADEAGLRRTADVNGPVQDGVDLTQVTQYRGRRWSAVDAFLRPAMRRGNLSVIRNALARRVLFDGTRATGVEYQRNGRLERALARRETILACGTIGSPHLLELSGVGDAQRLRQLGVPIVSDVPDVGEGMQDHLAAGIVTRCRTPVTLATADSPANVLRYLLFRSGPLTSNVAEACGFFRSDPSLAAPDLEVLFAPVGFLDHGIPPLKEHALTVGTVLLTPRSRGSVHARSARVEDAPEIDPRYLSDPDGDDLRRLAVGVQLCAQILNAPSLAPHVGAWIRPAAMDTTAAAIATGIRAHAESLYHPVGTCAMGGVVDEELRVHGCTGLRVIDASVMPEIVRGHTNAATMMIAEMGGAMVRASLGSS